MEGHVGERNGLVHVVGPSDEERADLVYDIRLLDDVVIDVEDNVLEVQVEVVEGDQAAEELSIQINNS